MPHHRRPGAAAAWHDARRGILVRVEKTLNTSMSSNNHHEAGDVASMKLEAGQPPRYAEDKTRRY